MRIYACNVCGNKNFRCTVTAKDDSESKPLYCPFIDEDNLEAEPKWRQVNWLGESLLELLKWKDEAYNEIEGAYPDWFWNATSAEGFKGCEAVLYEMKDALEEDQFVTRCWYDTELKKVLDAHTKKELVEAITRAAFSAGIMYGEWRRKVCKEEDWEIYEGEQ